MSETGTSFLHHAIDAQRTLNAYEATNCADCAHPRFLHRYRCMPERFQDSCLQCGCGTFHEWHPTYSREIL